jgi:hypothetical protein
MVRYATLPDASCTVERESHNGMDRDSFGPLFETRFHSPVANFGSYCRSEMRIVRQHRRTNKGHVATLLLTLICKLD